MKQVAIMNYVNVGACLLWLRQAREGQKIHGDQQVLDVIEQLARGLKPPG